MRLQLFKKTRLNKLNLRMKLPLKMLRLSRILILKKRVLNWQLRFLALPT